MAKKIIGWLLLIAGIVIISYSLFASYNIFTGKNPAPEIFSVPEEITTPLSQTQQGLLGIEDFQNQIGKMMREQLKELLPNNFLPTFFNLITWSIFASISIFAGTQISSLGIKLLKQ